MLKTDHYQSIAQLQLRAKTLNQELFFTIEELNEELTQKKQALVQNENELKALHQELHLTHKHLIAKQKELEASNQNLFRLNRQLEASVQQFRLMVEHTPAAVALLDSQLNYLAFSKKWLTSFNKEASILHQHHYDVFDNLPDHWKVIHQQGLEGHSTHHPGEKLILDGQEAWIKWSVRPWKIGNKIRGLILICEDITTHKEVEKKLVSTLENFKLLFNGIPEPVSRVDRNFRYLAANNAHKEMFGVDPEQVIGKSLQELGADDAFIERNEHYWREALNQRKVVKYYLKIDRDKEPLFFQVKAIPEINSENNEIESLLILTSDITKQENSKIRLKRSERKYKSLVNHLPHFILQFDQNFKLTYHNQSEDPRAPFAKHLKKGAEIKSLGLNEEDTVILREGLEQVLSQKKQIDWNQNFKISPEKFSYLMIAYPELDEEDRVDSIYLIAIDVTELRQAEINTQLLNEELAQLNEELSASNEQLITNQYELKNLVKKLEEKNNDLDNIVYKISHDIRSPLASILGLVEIIDDEENVQIINKYVKLIEGRVLKLDDFIRKMLDYAKANRKKPELETIDFTALIDQCWEDLSYMKDFDKVQKIVHIDLQDDAYWGDLLRLRIIFSNIISNAIKYQNFYASERFVKVDIVQDYKVLRLTFSDNGIGIPEEHLSKIFEMFYRAHEHSDGSGLGLYIVKKTIEKLKGKLIVRSKENLGTEIQVLLPVLSPEEIDQSNDWF